MSVPVAAGLREVEDATWHRLSPRMLLIHPVVEVGRASPVLIGLALTGGHDLHALIRSAVVTVLVIGLAITRWFTTRLRISPEQVELRTGLLRRRTIATRRERIRTVDVTSHALHRLLGLARVVVRTGTSDRKGNGRLVLDGLSAPVAGRLRDDLLHRVAAVSTPEQQGPHEDLHELARLDHRWIRLAPFTLSGAVTGFVIWGFLWRIQNESGVDLLRTGPLREADRSVQRVPTWAAVVAVALAVLVFVAVTSTAGYVLAFWRFRLARHDGGTLQVTRGLITTRATSIERARLAGVEISETLLLRLVGGARLLAVATGLRVGRGAERGGEVLLPPAPVGVTREVAVAVLDGTPAVTAPLRPHGPAARRRRMVRAVAGALVLLAAAVAGRLTGGSLWPVPVAVVLVLAAVPLGRDRYAGLGHTCAGGYLVTHYGSVVRRRTVLSTDAVVSWNARASVLQRRQGLVTLTATTAAGRQAYPVTDVAPAEAIALAGAVTPGLLEPFLVRPPGTHRASTR